MCVHSASTLSELLCGFGGVQCTHVVDMGCGDGFGNASLRTRSEAVCDGFLRTYWELCKNCTVGCAARHTQVREAVARMRFRTFGCAEERVMRV
jgi:hypothetical protein